MLSNIWVNVRGATGSGARFWISGRVAQHSGQVFWDAALGLYLTGSAGLLASLADPEEPWLRSPSIRRFFVIGVGGGSLTSKKVRVIHYRANVEGNG